MRRGGARLVALLIWSWTANPAIAAPIPIADFTSDVTLTRPLLSPDGKRIVAHQVDADQVRLVVMDVDKLNAPPRVFIVGKHSDPDVHWAGSSRLLLTTTTSAIFYGVRVPTLRLFSLDVETGASRPLDSKSAGIYGGDVLYADPAGAWALVASQSDLFSTPSVKRIELVSGIATVVEKDRPDIWSWYADRSGVVRAGVAYTDRDWTLWYRNNAAEPLSRIKGKFAKDDDSSVDQVTFGFGDHGTIVTNQKTGRFAVYQYDFSNGQIGDAIYENPTVDVESEWVDPLTGEVAGVGYEDDRYHTYWIDPTLKAVQVRLDKTFPDRINEIAGRSNDGNRLLIWSRGAADPGTYYLYDQAAKQMHPLFSPNDRIDPARLATVKPAHYAARDGLDLPAYLTLPPGRAATGLPLIVMPHGGPFVRDHWEYDPIVQFLASRGYAVLQPQFRGSTGYGKAFVERGNGEWGRKMQDDLDDGVDWLAKSGIADPKRVCMVGASYGGYAALWAATRNPERYRCAASIAGISDLGEQLAAVRSSFEAPRYFREFRDKVRGRQTFDLATVSPIRFADRVKVPLFIAHGEQDETVSPHQSKQMIDAIEKAHGDVTPLFLKDAGHDFGKPADFARLLKALEAFLAKNNPA